MLDAFAAGVVVELDFDTNSTSLFDNITAPACNTGGDLCNQTLAGGNMTATLEPCTVVVPLCTNATLSSANATSTREGTINATFAVCNATAALCNVTETDATGAQTATATACTVAVPACKPLTFRSLPDGSRWSIGVLNAEIERLSARETPLRRSLMVLSFGGNSGGAVSVVSGLEVCKAKGAASKVMVTGSLFDSNSAVTGSAMSVAGVQLVVADTVFRRNTAKRGTLAVSEPAVVYIYNTEFKQNRAENGGGAISTVMTSFNRGEVRVGPCLCPRRGSVRVDL
jgi:predicted outer membrane repeat protein